MANDTHQTKRGPVTFRYLTAYWPWGISIMVHLAVLAALSAVVFISFESRQARREIIPEARLGRITPHLPLFSPRLPDTDPMPEELLRKDLAKQIAPDLSQTPPRQGSLDVVAFSHSQDDDPHAADLGHVAAAAPKTRFFNAYGNAYSVVYVVDVSPSMLPFFKPLKRELKRCLGDLKPMQKFHVIFFSSGDPIEGPAKGLTWASDRNKRRYYAFIDAVDTDIKTDPRWAVKRALELNPDLIYLLTDGVFDRKLAGKIVQWSKARKIKINTIAYVNEQGAALLRHIAENTGGVYRLVSEGQLLWD